jgi:NADH-quinone oxidoreductase subunit L
MSAIAAMPWLSVAVPVTLAAAIALGSRFLGRAAVIPALVAPLLVVVVGWASLGHGASGSLVWIAAGGASLRVGYSVDGLGSLMLLVVGGVSACVMLFSAGYMRGERGYVRYFALLTLFVGAMSGLVIATDLVALFVAWELVGACSYLLIGFWYDRPAAADAARKAFLMTRVGDAALLLGMGAMWSMSTAAGRAGILDVRSIVAVARHAPPAAVTVAALCVLLAAVGKSAQFPLHGWLPDAMEGPTPVSALIHAAAMVAAGVFLVARMWGLFELSATARGVALALGAVTALGAATVAVTQTDIKKVLAWSTISQLGFMFAALGVGAWPAAIFHLVAHAAFKALLFLASGSVIHGSGTQDLRSMGGLWRRMPLTALTWILGGLALAGVWPMAGFFSKDAIVTSVWTIAPVAAAALLLASGLTGAYIARATQLGFFGAYRGDGRPHESGWTMTVPLLLLAIAAGTLGAAGRDIMAALAAPYEPLSAGVVAVTLALTGAGALAGWLPWARDAGAEAAFPGWLERAWRAARAGYGYDSMLERGVVRPVMTFALVAHALVDRLLIDGVIERGSKATRRASDLFLRLQGGDGQAYGMLVAVGTIAILVLAIALRSVG